MDLLSDGTRRALARWDGRPRQIAALLCASLAALLALTGGADDGRGEVPSDPVAAAPAAPADSLEPGAVAAVLPAGAATLAIGPGDYVDVYAAMPDPGAPAVQLAAAARVLAVPAAASRGGSGEAAGYIVVELTESAALALAGAADARLTVVVRARGG